MPEGHTVHRAARLHREAFAGTRPRAWSPQGRFSEGARLLDGRLLRDVDAYGKHLFYRWDGTPAPSPGGGAAQERRETLTLHVHLGLFGRFRMFTGSPPPPTEGTRLALATPERTLYLSGPTACELLNPDQEARLFARLGPDPLRADADSGRARASLARRRVPIGQALLDQGVVAGIGNAFRAEALFLAGLDPLRPACSLTDDEFEVLWSLLVRLLRAGERSGRIDTVANAERGTADDGMTRYVYRRAGSPCLRCGTVISARPLGGRALYGCPTCQRMPASAS